MKVSSRVMVAWAITVFLVIGAVFIAITMIRGDDTDMEDQPTGGSPLVSLSAAAPSHLAAHLAA